MSKIIFDPIHKHMEFNSTLISIIDTIEFQRLKNIKQLGLCYYVFPGASHNRFEHSLGVCYLSGILINNLKNNQPELNIDNSLIMCIQIAGLIHDIGHSCFSHFFDHHFLYNEIKNSNYKDHEYRSCVMFDHIVSKYKINLSDLEIELIKKMINPTDEDTSFIFQIVSNNINGLDCDKFDYIMRDTYNIGLSYSYDCARLLNHAKVINDKICFPKKCYNEIYDLYYTRYKLHKQIYTHPAVRSLEYMVLDLIKELNKDLNLIEKTTDITKFHILTDNILDFSYIIENKEAIKIYDNIKSRNLYKFILEIKYDNFDFKSYYNSNSDIKKYIIFDNLKLNFSKNDKNPLDYVFLYDKNNKICNNDDISLIYPIIFEEKIIRIYSKLNDKNELIKEYVLNYIKM